jgi:hypothetical protein
LSFAQARGRFFGEPEWHADAGRIVPEWHADAGRIVSSYMPVDDHRTGHNEEDYGMAGRNPPRKVTYFEPIAPRLARNTVIGSTFMRVPGDVAYDSGMMSPTRYDLMSPCVPR